MMWCDNAVVKVWLGLDKEILGYSWGKIMIWVKKVKVRKHHVFFNVPTWG